MATAEISYGMGTCWELSSWQKMFGRKLKGLDELTGLSLCSGKNGRLEQSLQFGLYELKILI